MKKILISLEILLLVIFVGYSNVGAYISGNSQDIIYFSLYNAEYKIFETSVSSINYMVNEKLDIPQKEGYQFDGWYYDKKFLLKVKNNTSLNIDGKKLKENTLYGRWVKNT